jgi:AcrR family transcriptional regulator
MLVDRDGIEGLSLRRLGSDLGVEAMTVHYHTGGKEGLLDGVVEGVLGELEMPPAVPGMSWPDRLREFALAYRTALLRHPRALPLVATRPPRTRESLRVIEMVLSVLRRGGVGPSRAMNIANTLVAYVVGYAMLESGDTQTAEHPSSRDDLLELVKGLPAGDLPVLVDTVSALDPDAVDNDAAFASGLDALLTGLADTEAFEE